MRDYSVIVIARDVICVVAGDVVVVAVVVGSVAGICADSIYLLVIAFVVVGCCCFRNNIKMFLSIRCRNLHERRTIRS